MHFGDSWNENTKDENLSDAHSSGSPEVVDSRDMNSTEYNRYPQNTDSYEASEASGDYDEDEAAEAEEDMMEAWAENDELIAEAEAEAHMEEGSEDNGYDRDDHEQDEHHNDPNGDEYSSEHSSDEYSSNDEQNDNDAQSAIKALEVARQYSQKQTGPTWEEVQQLKAELQQLYATQRDQLRQLLEAELQADAARSESERLAVQNKTNEQELSRVRQEAQMQHDRATTRAVDLRVKIEAMKVDLATKENAYKALNERYENQSIDLVKLRTSVAELERKNISYSAQAAKAARSEARAQRELEQLRDELMVTINEVSQTRAELAAQSQTMADVKQEARREALNALAEDLYASEEALYDLSDDVKSFSNNYKNAAAHSLAAEQHDDALLWRRRYVGLRREMDAIASDFEKRKPEIISLQNAYEESQLQLQKLEAENRNYKEIEAEQVRRVYRAERGTRDAELENKLIESLLTDLRRQLLVLLTEKQLDSKLSASEEDDLVRLREEIGRKNSQEILESVELNGGDERAASSARSGQELITEKLVLFKDVSELQSQNEALIRACRELASLVDPKANYAASALVDSNHSYVKDIEDAGHALQTMQQRCKKLTIELQAAQKHSVQSEQDSKANEQEIQKLRGTVDSLEEQLATLRRRLLTDNDANEQETAQAATEASARTEALLKIQIERLEGQFNDSQEVVAQLRDELRLATNQYATSQLALGRAEQASSEAEKNAASLGAQLAESKRTNAQLSTRLQFWGERERELLSQVARAESDAAAARSQSGRSAADHSELQQRLMSQVEKIEALVASGPGGERAAQAEKRAEQLEHRVKQLEQTLTELNVKSENAKARATQLTSEISEAQQRLATAKEQSDAIKAAKQTLESKCAELEAKVDQVEQESREQQDTASKRNDELVDKVNDLEDQLTEALKDAERERERVKLIEKEVEQAEQEREQERERAQRAEQDLQREQAKREQAKREQAEREEAEREQAKSEQAEHEQPQHVQEEPQTGIEEKAAPGEEEENLTDIDSLRKSLAKRTSNEAVSRFESVVLQTEQSRVKDAISRKLQEVRQQSLEELAAKTAEAEQRGEERATKRGEIRNKLQSNKVAKLEEQNKQLEEQVNELRNKVRRLKGGETDVDIDPPGPPPTAPAAIAPPAASQSSQQLSPQPTQQPPQEPSPHLASQPTQPDQPVGFPRFSGHDGPSAFGTPSSFGAPSSFGTSSAFGTPSAFFANPQSKQSSFNPFAAAAGDSKRPMPFNDQESKKRKEE